MNEKFDKYFHLQEVCRTDRVKKISKKGRWYKNIGLGFKIPSEAINGKYIDKKCPFTGDISIRGRILTGKVISTKMKNTVIVKREYLRFIPKYSRYEKRHSHISAHCSPCFKDIKEGSIVTIGECRPLSKTVRFNVIKVNSTSNINDSSKGKRFVPF